MQNSPQVLFHKWAQWTSEIVFNTRKEILFLQGTMQFSFDLDIKSSRYSKGSFILFIWKTKIWTWL